MFRHTQPHGLPHQSPYRLFHQHQERQLNAYRQAVGRLLNAAVEDHCMNCQRTLWSRDDALVMRVCVDLDVVASCVGRIMFMFRRDGWLGKCGTKRE